MFDRPATNRHCRMFATLSSQLGSADNVGMPVQGLAASACAAPARASSSAAAAPPPPAVDLGGLELRSRGLGVADLILGCGFLAPAPAGGGLAPVAREVAAATVVAAIEHGIRTLDTAPLYGAGVSEESVGAGLAALGLELAAEVQVISKSGVMIREAGATALDAPPPAVGFAGKRATHRDYSAGSAALALRESLTRLGVDRLSELRVHGPHRTDRVMIEGTMQSKLDQDGIETVLGKGGLLEGLVALREAGTIEHVSLGLNAFDPDIVPRLLPLFTEPADGVVQSALLAGGWNLLNQEAAPLMLAAQRRGIGIHVAGVFSSGLLTGGSTVYHQGSDSGQPPPPEVLALLRGWETLVGEHQLELATVALAFACLPRCVTKVVVGCSHASEVVENVARLPGVAAVPASLWAQARARGLLPPSLHVLA